MQLNTDQVLFTRRGNIGIVTINSPERRNAINLSMWKALQECFEQMSIDDEIRVVIITGAGGVSFCSGADISEFKTLRATAIDATKYDAQLEASRIAMCYFNKPLIAMIDGYCLAGGLALAMYADFRIASEKSIFGVPAAKMGLAYTLESFVLMVQLIGRAATADLLMTARRIDATEACSLGLVNSVVSSETLEETVFALAGQIAANAPLSVRATKEIIEDIMKPSEQREPGLAQKWRDICHDSDDFREGQKAFAEKRKPVFIGR